MTEYKGISYLRNKLNNKRPRVLERYEYYEMKNCVKDRSRMTPPGMQWLNGTLGWCGKAVDSIADRLIFRTFQDDHFDINQIYSMNNPDTLFDSAILSSLISSCCFIYISSDRDGYPRMQIIDGSNATGIIDPITGLLKEGYAVLKRDNYKKPMLEAYFVPGRTDYVYKREDKTESIKNPAPYPLLVPVIFRPDAARPFGHSRISRSCMSIMQSALRTIKRAEISGEFYSYPQRYILGLDEDVEIDKWKATMSSLLTLTKNDNGQNPTIGQFQQQSMTPYIEQLKMFAALFSGETGLTMDDLGFVSDNPSSAEAIKASHENLRLIARKAQRTFGTGFLNAGYLAACLRDDMTYSRRQINLTIPAWEPIFEPDAAMLSSIGDGAIKINQAVPGYFDTDNLRNLTGINESKAEQQAITPPPTIDNKITESTQNKGLNGAQTQSLITIISQFTSGILSEGQAVNLIATSTGLNKEEASKILKGVV